MALWPFRKRRKRSADGKKAATQDAGVERKSSISRSHSKRQMPRRNASRRSVKDRETSYASSTGPVPDFPLPPNQPGYSATVMAHEFQPKKQQHEGGFSSYFVEHNPSVTASSVSSHRPHKQSSLIRKLSRRNDHSHPPPPSAYATQIGRQDSKNKRSRQIPGREGSIISTIPRDSLHSSLSSHSSQRAFKIRSIDVFSPRPTLRYEDGSSPTSLRSKHSPAPGLTPSRSNSRRSNSRTTANAEWRYREDAILEEELLGHNRVDDLADELDSRGLREAMDRDRRRRERRKREEQDRLQRKLERRALRDNAEHQDVDQDYDMERGYDDYQMPDADIGESSRSAVPDAQIGYAISAPYVDVNARQSTMGTQTPLSWLDINPSTEDVNKRHQSTLQQFVPRPDVVTPISMDSREHPREDVPELDDTEDLENSIGIARVSPLPEEEPAQEPASRSKTSIWTSFIKKATAARMKKDHMPQQQPSSRAIQVGQSALISDSEEEEEMGNIMEEEEEKPENAYLEVDDLRHREGQTPGRHVPEEVAFAMTALETGHIHDQEYEDEMRDSVPLEPYHPPDSPNSSKSSLGQHNLSPRPQHSWGSNRQLSPTPDDRVDSPTVVLQSARHSSQSFKQPSRPPSTQRYSPSMHRHSSGATSPENGPRSVMSTSLASIDSEGSWLSGGKANARRSDPNHSAQPISPLRTSASSLRKRYQELEGEGEGDMEGDDYFSGVAKRPRKEHSQDEEAGGARLDLSDAEESESEDEGSVNSEVEKNMWRGGVEKKVVVHERSSHVRAKSREGMLNDYDDEEDDQQRRASNASTEKAVSPTVTADSSAFATPSEHPFARTISSNSEFQNEFQTPLEHPRMGYV